MGGVSAIIVSYETGPILEACVNAALAETAIEEVILVDNGNGADGAALIDRLCTDYARVTLIRGHGNVGFARGCNMGAARAESGRVLFLNPDLVIKPGAVAAMITALNAAPGPAIVGGRLVDKNGAEQRGARRDRLTLGAAFVGFLGLSRVGFRDPMRHRDPLPSSPVEVGAVSGAMMLMRRADFDALGGFDEDYFLHVEDFDICRRVQDAGGAVLFAPQAEGVHAGATSAAPAHVIELHKARGFRRYFTRFARSPLERAMGGAAGAALEVILPLRARLRRRSRAQH